MDNPDFNICCFMENIIGLKSYRVKSGNSDNRLNSDSDLVSFIFELLE